MPWRSVSWMPGAEGAEEVWRVVVGCLLVEEVVCVKVEGFWDWGMMRIDWNEVS